MKILIMLTTLSLITMGCGQKRSGKRIGRVNRIEMEQTKEKVSLLKVASLKNQKIEISSESRGVVKSKGLMNSKERFLRNKILRHAFLNLANKRSNSNLEVTLRDTFKFFPRELSFESKIELKESLQENEEDQFNLNSEGEISWEGIGKSSSLENITMAVGVKHKLSGLITYFGTGKLQSLTRQIMSFDSKTRKRDFFLHIKRLPGEILKKASSLNTQGFLEVLDFDLDGMNMAEYLKNKQKGKTLLVISTPKKEFSYLIPNGQSLKSYLKTIDGNLSWNSQGKIRNFLDYYQDEVFSWPDRNTLENIEIYDDKKIWWSNIDKPLVDLKAQGSPIVLAFSSYRDLRGTRYFWKEIKEEVEDGRVFSFENNIKIVGKLNKEVRSSSFKEFYKVIPFEIGKKFCPEDHRFERKGIDCSLVWEAAFSNPTAIFRSLKEELTLKLSAESKDIVIDEKKDLINSNGFLELDIERGFPRKVSIVNKGKIKVLQGGFIGWKSFDQRLKSYKTRAPFDDLSTHNLKIGTRINYYLQGWSLGFRFLD